MITKVCARNFRSIGERIELELGAMTVLVGPNASGKSNIVDVLRFLAECVTATLPHAIRARSGFRALQHGGPWEPGDVTIEVWVEREEGRGTWGFTLRGDEGDAARIAHEHGVWFAGSAPDAASQRRLLDLLGGSARMPNEAEIKAAAGEDTYAFSSDGAVTSSNTLAFPLALFGDRTPILPLMHGGPFACIVEELRRIAVYGLFPSFLREPQRPDPSRPMSTWGDNWASVLESLSSDGGGSELLAALGRLATDIDRYRVIHAGGFLVPEFRHGLDAQGRERWLGAAQESDGTLRVAAMLTALFQEPAPALVGFEEPELGVHPGAIPLLFDFLKEATTRSQILLTTHSPDLLDLVPIDDIRVVERRDGATTVARVEERQRELVRKRLMSTSDLLHAEGLRPEGSTSDG
ncbi:AAA family ATPase [Sorangium sp. So ce693]|uniref:AAA family ATPase n=1 Tax=Sorangium sp. So ce693 TaxID=3133318 RepID=UPI003F608831